MTQEELKKEVYYDWKTGIFTWIIKKKGRLNKVGNIHPNGYLMIVFGGKAYSAHRLAFLYMRGYFPKIVDHYNRVRNDNRWFNLKEASYLINAKNTKLYKSNNTGVPGVLFNKHSKKWVVGISNNGKIHLGTYKTFEEAVKVREQAEIKYGYNPRHGN